MKNFEETIISEIVKMLTEEELYTEEEAKLIAKKWNNKLAGDMWTKFDEQIEELFLKTRRER